MIDTNQFYTRLPKEITSCIVDNAIDGGGYFIISKVCKGWKEYAEKKDLEALLEDSIIPRIKELSKSLPTLNNSLFNARVACKLANLCDWTLLAYEIKELPIANKSYYIFKRYLELSDLSSFLYDSIRDNGYSYSLPSIFHESLSLRPAEMTPEFVLKEFKKLGLISSQRDSLPEELMKLDQFHYSAAFRVSLTQPGVITYVCSGDNKISLIRLTAEKLKSYSSLIEIFNEAFRNRRCRFGHLVASNIELSPLEDIWEGKNCLFAYRGGSDPLLETLKNAKLPKQRQNPWSKPGKLLEILKNDS